MSNPSSAIDPQREVDFPEWYQQVLAAADLAESSEVRGCMVIKPWGYGIWEQIQQALDRKFKATGHENAYFPLFIPLSYLEKEAAHVEGFAKECAVVTHHRLEADGNGKLVPAAPLTEPLVVRPTSETIIGAAFARWIESYRDLPVLINQWANVVRWEMRPRLFLRTAEFLWQEGHTAHETEEEAREETRQMLGVYADFARDYMALPVIEGHKSESERFPGAVDTLCIEAMVQDCKAVQAGTSHFLGQNFSKAAGIEFLSRENQLTHAYTTSWGVSTRLIGTLIMAHGDDDGIRLPPRLAPSQVVILPVIPKDKFRDSVLDACDRIAAQLRELRWQDDPVRVHVDKRDRPGGTKNWEWIKKGAPVRVEIGPRDIESGSVFVGRRDKGHKDKSSYPVDEFLHAVPGILDEIQQALYDQALAFRDTHTRDIDSQEEFYAFFTPRNEEKPEIHGGFARTHWNGSPEVEEQIKNDLKVTIRCIPQETDARKKVSGTCPFSGEPSPQRVIWAKSY